MVVPPTVNVVPLETTTVPELVKLLAAVVKVAALARVNVPVFLLKPASALLVPSRIFAELPLKVRLAALVVMPPLALASCIVPPTV